MHLHRSLFLFVAVGIAHTTAAQRVRHPDGAYIWDTAALDQQGHLLVRECHGMFQHLRHHLGCVTVKQNVTESENTTAKTNGAENENVNTSVNVNSGPDPDRQQA